MSADVNANQYPEPDSDTPPGYCSGNCTNRQELVQHIHRKEKEIKTSDIFHTCNLPKRFEYPHWFNGYGCQTSKAHPLYRTSTSEYGWYPPAYHCVPSVYYPRSQQFTNHLGAAGMYKNYSLNTALKD